MQVIVFCHKYTVQHTKAINFIGLGELRPISVSSVLEYYFVRKGAELLNI